MASLPSRTSVSRTPVIRTTPHQKVPYGVKLAACGALVVWTLGHGTTALAQPAPDSPAADSPAARSPAAATVKPAIPPKAAALPSGLSIEERDRQADALSQSMMSPFCPGRTLSACPSPKAGEWRADIRTWVGEGVSAEEIRLRLAARIPQHDLFGIPKTPLGWALPIALALAALALLIGLMRVLLKPRALAEIGKDSISPVGLEKKEWEARLDQELDAIDQ